MYEIRKEQLIGKVDGKLVEPVLLVRRYEGMALVRDMDVVLAGPRA